MFVKILKADFPSLLNSALEKGALRVKNAISGFAKTGICPLDNQKAKESGKLEPGNVLDLSYSEEELEQFSDEAGPSGLQQSSAVSRRVVIDSDSDQMESALG